MVEVVLRHEALVVPLAGEALVVLSHQLLVFLVGVDRLAEFDEVVVAVEAAEVNPQTAERAVVVLAVSTRLHSEGRLPCSPVRCVVLRLLEESGIADVISSPDGKFWRKLLKCNFI